MSGMIEMKITLYSKSDCSLCEQLKEDLGWLAQEIPFVIEECDIEADAETMARFRYLVPVLAVARAGGSRDDDGDDGDLYLYPPFDLVELRHTLLHTAKPEATSQFPAPH
jgi:hypothetical protein